MKPGKKLYLLKVSLVFILIEISIATLATFLFFSSGLQIIHGLYIIYYIWEVSRDTNIVWNKFGTDIYRKIT